MRKRNLFIIALSIIILVIFVSVINLSNKNNALGFISDDSRQIALVCDLYTQIINEEISAPTNLTKDTSIYINFITYGHYVISNETKINEIFKNKLLTENNPESRNFTLKNEFDVKTLTLKIYVKDEDNSSCKIYSYKLGKDKKNNSISYKLIDTEITIE